MKMPSLANIVFSCRVVVRKKNNRRNNCDIPTYVSVRCTVCMHVYSSSTITSKATLRGGTRLGICQRWGKSKAGYAASTMYNTGTSSQYSGFSQYTVGARPQPGDEAASYRLMRGLRRRHTFLRFFAAPPITIRTEEK